MNGAGKILTGFVVNRGIGDQRVSDDLTLVVTAHNADHFTAPQLGDLCGH